MGEPTTGDATETTEQPLVFGAGFRALLEDEGEVEAACIHQAHLDVFGRLADGRIRCWPLRKVKRIAARTQIAPLRSGDEVLLESPAGKLRGTLTGLPADPVVIRLRHGQDVQVPRSQVRALSLVHPMHELIAGARFEVKSQSGNRYEGSVSQVLPDRRALVKLTTGKTVELKLDRLDLASLLVLIPISIEPPVEALLAPQPEAEPAPASSAAEDGPATDLAQELERERRSSASLKRKMVQLLLERDALAKDVKQRERMLESEVWRGLAAQRDLSEAKKKLESLESEVEEERRGLA